MKCISKLTAVADACCIDLAMVNKNNMAMTILVKERILVATKNMLNTLTVLAILK